MIIECVKGVGREGSVIRLFVFWFFLWVESLWKIFRGDVNLFEF